MAQQRIDINSAGIYQPDSGLTYSFESTYTSDSTRTQDGVGHFTPMFTVEQLGYTATGIPVAEATKILRQIIKGKSFTLHYYSLYYGAWRDDTFYVGKGECEIGTLEDGGETLSSLKFNMTGVNPI
uniref:Uncharacterized protein n=1 Tax=Siphoviridae sp. ctoWO12 TaxID=2826461 RepID=A0A8S5QYK9_9CAUD|nr:MAG TPA: hypothetical protein [Siphoviridae sp. ctoWO12]DAJ81050.1 MAG TPA: hypothetical protein [Caudoviricetes sp.]